MRKDTLERAREPNINLKAYLQQAYVHPVFKAGDDDEEDDEFEGKWMKDDTLVPTKRASRRNTPAASKISGASSPLIPGSVKEHEEP